jgi:hypothetical protein
MVAKYSGFTGTSAYRLAWYVASVRIDSVGAQSMSKASRRAVVEKDQHPCLDLPVGWGLIEGTRHKGH